MSDIFSGLKLTKQQRQIVILLITGVPEEDIAMRLRLSMAELQKQKKTITKEMRKSTKVKK
ncbi:MAG: hypothetical protein A2Z75_02915 [Chloroflexi bacterium RBG_13_50_10]|nr:MAG: hypothetical protein A2Z75_02915 [Chloroflexi bacterium RBG_13_50_10]